MGRSSLVGLAVAAAVVALVTPARADSLSGADKHNVSKFQTAYRSGMGYLRDAKPADVVKEAAFYDKKEKEMRAALAAITNKTHASVVECQKSLDEYVKLLAETRPPAAEGTEAPTSYSDQQTLDSFDAKMRAGPWASSPATVRKAGEAACKRALDEATAVLAKISPRSAKHPTIEERRKLLEHSAGLCDEVLGKRPPGELPLDKPLTEKQKEAIGKFDAALAKATPALSRTDKDDELVARRAYWSLERLLEPMAPLLANLEVRKREYELFSWHGKIDAAFGPIPRDVTAEEATAWQAMHDEYTSYSKDVNPLARTKVFSLQALDAVKSDLELAKALEPRARELRKQVISFHARWGKTFEDASQTLLRVFGRTVNLSTSLPDTAGGKKIDWPQRWSYHESVLESFAVPRHYREKLADTELEAARKHLHDGQQTKGDHCPAHYVVLETLKKDCARLELFVPYLEGEPKLLEKFKAFLAEAPEKDKTIRTALSAALAKMEWAPNSPKFTGDAAKEIKRIQDYMKNAAAVRMDGDWIPYYEKRKGKEILKRKDGQPISWGLVAEVAFELPEKNHHDGMPPREKLYLARVYTFYTEYDKETAFESNAASVGERLILREKVTHGGR